MKNAPTGKQYLAMLGEELPRLLPSGFQKSESTCPRFTRRQPGRTEHVGISLRTKFWPSGKFDLTFGVSYDEFQPLFDAIVNQYNLDIPHIHHDTMNIHLMEGLPYFPRIAFTKLPFIWRFINLGDWPCYRDEDPKKAIRRTKGAIRGVIEPFFQRFADIRQAWYSLRDRDGWNMQGWDYKVVLAFGAFLEDWKGLEVARRRLILNLSDEGIVRVDEYLQHLRTFLQTSSTLPQQFVDDNLL